MMDFTTLAEPIAHRQIYEKVLLSASVAYRRCGLPTSDGFNALTALFRLPEHLEHELTEAEIRDFASPKTFQVSVKVQVLKETEVKLTDKRQRKFPVMILALSLNLAMGSGRVLARTLAVTTAFYLPRQLAIGLFYLLGRLLIEFR